MDDPFLSLLVFVFQAFHKQAMVVFCKREKGTAMYIYIYMYTNYDYEAKLHDIKPL